MGPIDDLNTWKELLASSTTYEKHTFEEIGARVCHGMKWLVCLKYPFKYEIPVVGKDGLYKVTVTRDDSSESP